MSNEIDSTKTETGNGDAATRKSGRASFDGDGRGVWEWQVATGVFTRTVTEDQLMELARCNLELMDDAMADSGPEVSLYQRARAPTATRPAGWPKAEGQESTLRRLFRRR